MVTPSTSNFRPRRMLMFLRFNKVGKQSAEAMERDYNHSLTEGPDMLFSDYTSTRVPENMDRFAIHKIKPLAVMMDGEVIRGELPKE